MNPKLIAASISALLVAAGLFVYLGTGLEPAETIEPAAATGEFAGQESHEAEPWMPAPGMGTLADASIDALHEISVGASPSEALEKASSSRALALNSNLDDWFAPEAIENCEYQYWFMSDSVVNVCYPFESYAGSPTALPTLGANNINGVVFDVGSLFPHVFGGWTIVSGWGNTIGGDGSGNLIDGSGNLVENVSWSHSSAHLGLVIIGDFNHVLDTNWGVTIIGDNNVISGYNDGSTFVGDGIVA